MRLKTDDMGALNTVCTEGAESRVLPVNEFTLVSFEGVITLLKQAIPVGSIYNLSKGNDALDLIIVLEKGCGRKLEIFDDIIDISLLGYENSYCTLHTFGHLNQQICEGNLFYGTACAEENLIYRKSVSNQLPVVNAQVYQNRKAYLDVLFNAEMKRACSFFDGASYYVGNRQLELAVFMLQQSVELTYRCFLNLLRGKDMKCHSLSTLRKNIRRGASKLIGIFSKEEEEELFYLDFLEKGYCEARYNREYRVDKEMVLWLRQKVWELHSTAFDLYASMMNTMEKGTLEGLVSLEIEL
ncbi:HEPN domain-containing protein [Pedobacter sp.]|uniref:HEPN domain-containing protein n=1 Tax=Pedobacter sp. TaxID=1411316 RepID=UPI0031CEB039